MLSRHTGFLEAADFDLLFAPFLTIDCDLTRGCDKLQRTDDRADRRQKQRTVLAQAFLPFLQQRLIRQFIVQTMTAHTGADPVLVESLVTDERLLAVAPKPLLASFAATGERGVTPTFFDSDDLSGAAQADASIAARCGHGLKATKDADGNPLNPANSARFEGYLEVPTPGAYRFYCRAGQAERRSRAALRSSA